MSVVEAMTVPALRRYRLRRLRLPVGRGQLDLVIPDADAYRRGGAWVDAALRGAEPPYWCEIWPAALAAARVLARLELEGQTVLDLGCGLGVPGIAAAAGGAAVTFADAQPDALQFAQWNATRAHPERRAPKTVRFDWARDVLPEQYAVMVLADVTYDPRHHAPLQRQIAAALAPAGVVLHADPRRPDSAPFVAWLRQRFATVEFERAVVLGERRAVVRLCAAARAPDVLAAWGRRLGGTPG